MALNTQTGITNKVFQGISFQGSEILSSYLCQKKINTLGKGESLKLESFQNHIHHSEFKILKNQF